MVSVDPQKLLNFSYIAKWLEYASHKNINPQTVLASKTTEYLDLRTNFSVTLFLE